MRLEPDGDERVEDVDDLIEALERFRDEEGGGVPVRAFETGTHLRLYYSHGELRI